VNTLRAKLFSNLDFVQIHSLRIHAHAVLMQTEISHFVVGDPRERTRLFGYLLDTTTPTFEWDVPSDKFSIAPARSPHVFLRSDGGTEPLSTGAILRFEGAGQVDIQLVAHDTRYQIKVEDVEGSPAAIAERSRRLVRERVEQFWTPPFIGELHMRRKDGN
jgi:hypothetical protein